MATYYGMISMLDKYVGKILDQLDELNLAEDTLVVFTTDHGHFFGQHGLHDKGAFHYEDVIKLPFIVRYKGKVPADKVSSSMQSLVDLTPTFLSFSDIKIPLEMGGVDQKEVWLGEKQQARDHIICENRSQPTAVHLKTFVNQRYKLTLYYNRTYGELFDLETDPNELNNLFDDPHSLQLKADLLLKYAWAELGKEPLNMPRISGA